MKKFIKIPQAYCPIFATLAVILALLSCSSDDGGGTGNSNGVVYGTSVIYEGETYETVVIGTQTWFKRNLNYAVEGSRCYDDTQENCQKYGRLYDWYTAKSACPSGFHLPTEEEWDTLVIFVESDQECTSCAGKHLKSKSGWNDGYYERTSGNGLDSYGFSALPGDFGFSDEVYFFTPIFVAGGYWWSASEYNSNSAYFLHIDYGNEVVDSPNLVDFHKGSLFSVRCIKD